MLDSSFNTSLVSTNNNFAKTYSLKSKPNLLKGSKTPKKSQQHKQPSEPSYIAASLANIQKGCINQKTGQLIIDGGYGDYKLKIFRKKDKLKHFTDPSSIFSDKDFIQNIFDSFNLPSKNLNPQKTQTSILEDEPLSPKKINRNQKAKSGLKRQNSIISPSLKEIELLKQYQRNNNYLNEENSELLSKINEILAKPRDHYIQKPVQINEEEEQKKKLRKGPQQQLRQKEGHLFYRSIPKYMAQKWFKTIDNSTADGNRVIPYVQQPVILPPPKKNHHKRTHIFRFLEQNCKFKSQKAYNSMILQ